MSWNLSNFKTAGSRTRWAAVGAALAVVLGAGGTISIVDATISSGDRPVFIPITACRLIDTRPAFQIGSRSSPLAPDETLTVDSHGTNGDCSIPSDAGALSLNVTAVGATLPTFLSIWPASTTRPNASNLNPVPGQPPTPNAVTTELSANGKFKIYNKQGNVHVIADVNGYYADHHHDDRYATKLESGARPIAVSVSTTNASESAPHTDGVILSATLEAPAAGVIQVRGSMFLQTNDSAPSLFACRVTEGAGATTNSSTDDLDDTDRVLTVHNTTEAGFCATNGATAVDAGTYVINLVARRSTTDDEYDDATLDLLFVPGEDSTVTKS